MVKITVLYGHPQDPAAFERYYMHTHMPIATKIATVRRYEISKPAGTPDGGAPPHFWMAELYFDDDAHLQRVLATPEAQAAIADIQNFATGGATMFISPVIEVGQT